jgi:threonine/homoserine/homoserine lactone efflux protein
MTGHWTRQLGSLGLLLVVLVALAVLLPLLGAPAMLMQAGGWVAAAMLLFLAVQFVVFRALDLRSRADEREEPAAELEQRDEQDVDWRAWRG